MCDTKAYVYVIYLCIYSGCDIMLEKGKCIMNYVLDGKGEVKRVTDDR